MSSEVNERDAFGVSHSVPCSSSEGIGKSCLKTIREFLFQTSGFQPKMAVFLYCKNVFVKR